MVHTSKASVDGSCTTEEPVIYESLVRHIISQDQPALLQTGDLSQAIETWMCSESSPPLGSHVPVRAYFGDPEPSQVWSGEVKLSYVFADDDELAGAWAHPLPGSDIGVDIHMPLQGESSADGIRLSRKPC